MAKITLHFQLGKYPSNADMALAFTISEDVIYDAFSPIDTPSLNCDFLTREFVCTNSQKIKKTRMTRERISKMLTQDIVGHILDAMGKNDTIMGYTDV